MTSFPLDSFFSGHVFAFLLIFCRVGCILMLFPGISETYVAPRMRMLLALSISLLLMGPLLPLLPQPPDAISDLTRIIGYEIAVGVFFGTTLRIAINALETAGSIIALQTGLSNATVLNPALASQSPLATAFLSVTGVTLIFITGFDYYLLHSFRALYDVFPPGGDIAIGDMTQFIIQIVSNSFRMGIQLSAPFLIMGLLLFIAVGMMQRLLPQIQLFIVVLPVQIWGGITLIAVIIASVMTVWLRYADTTIASVFVR